MRKKIFITTLILLLLPHYIIAYDINKQPPLAHKSQAIECIKDRKASKKFINSVDFIYEYSQKLNVDPTIVIAISCLETGYGKSNLFVNYNNPGGIKSRNGWKQFDTIEDGYKYMIELLATYSGQINKSWRIYNKAITTEQLGNYYWVENGADKGYHDKLTIMINAILSYPIKQDNDTLPYKKKKKSALDIIYSKINRSKGRGLQLIWERIGR